MRDHIVREEEQLFPLNDRQLTEADWQAMQAMQAMQDKLQSAEDPLFGSTVGDRYKSLHRQIATHAECGCFDERRGKQGAEHVDRDEQVMRKIA